MKTSILNCLLEAYRRNLMHGNNDFNRHKPLGDRWLGLGMEPEYRQTISEGYMKWITIPSPRTMGWLRLTPHGEAVIKMFGEKGITLKDFDGYDFTAHPKLGNIEFL